MPPPPNVGEAFRWFFTIIKWAFDGLIAAIVIAWLIFHWQTVVEWLQLLVNGWRAFWASLFGGRMGERNSESATAPRPVRSFSDYFDPFAQGVAATWQPVELVRYSFEALRRGDTTTAGRAGRIKRPTISRARSR